MKKGVGFSLLADPISSASVAPLSAEPWEWGILICQIVCWILAILLVLQALRPRFRGRRRRPWPPFVLAVVVVGLTIVWPWISVAILILGGLVLARPRPEVVR